MSGLKGYWTFNDGTTANDSHAAEVLEDELLDDGDFDLTADQLNDVTGTYWETDSSGIWTIVGGQAVCDTQYGSGVDLIDQTGTIITGRTYKCSYEIISSTAPSTAYVSLRLGGVPGAQKKAVGVHTEYITATNTNAFRMQSGTAVNPGEMVIDNISVKETNLNHGAITNAIHSPLVPIQKYSMNFNGTSDYVVLNNPFESVFQDSFTISAWIKPTDGQPAVINSIFNTTRELGNWPGYIYLQIDEATGYISFQHGVFSGQAKNIVSINAFIDDEHPWHHVVAVYTNLPGEDDCEMDLYIDGRLAKHESFDDHDTSDYSNPDVSVVIGARHLLPNGPAILRADRFFDGKIDDVALFDKALSVSEIETIYNEDSGPQLILQGTFDESDSAGALTGWTEAGAASAGSYLSFNTNGARIVYDETDADVGHYLQLPGLLVVGEMYRMTWDVTASSGAGYAKFDEIPGDGSNFKAVKSYEETFVATLATISFIRHIPSASCDVTINNVSCTRVNGLPTNLRYHTNLAGYWTFNDGATANDSRNEVLSDLIVNGDMELDDNWPNFTGSVSNTQSDEQAHSGTYSRKIVTDATVNGVRSDYFSTEAGKEYTMTLWIYIDEVTGGAGSPLIRMQDGDSNNMGTYDATGVLGEWTKITITRTSAVTGSAAFVKVYQNGPTPPATGGMTLYIDDVSVIESNLNHGTMTHDELLGAELIGEATNRTFGDVGTNDWIAHDPAGGSVTTAIIDDYKLEVTTTTDGSGAGGTIEGAELPVEDIGDGTTTTILAGKTYKVTMEIQQTTPGSLMGEVMQIGLGGTLCPAFEITASEVEYTKYITTVNLTGGLLVYNTIGTASVFTIDDVSVKETNLIDGVASNPTHDSDIPS